jgi:glutamyl-tRNA synthetase
MPREGVCEFKDHIRGDVRVEWATEQDTVIQRSDGTVTYNLANVVDDFDMKITHVIRAEEHLSNTPRQIFMLEGLGYPRPQYAHVPFVAEPGSKNKLSKRKIAQYLKNPDFKKVYDHAKAIADRFGLATAPESFNPVLVEFYEQVGYLPDAIVNYLVLLGWSLDDKSEDFTREQMIDLFSLERVNKASASLDVKKLFAFQERYMQRLPVAEKVDRVLPFLTRAGLVTHTIPDSPHPPLRGDLPHKGGGEEATGFPPPTSPLVGEVGSRSDPGGGWIAGVARPLVQQVVEAIGPRLVVAGDILEYDYLFLPDDALPLFDPAVAEKCVKDAYKKADRVPPLAEVLPKLRAIVADAQPFDPATLKQRTEEYAQSTGGKPGPLSNVLRVATTGKEVGFSAYDTLAVLGRDRCLARIDRALGGI